MNEENQRLKAMGCKPARYKEHPDLQSECTFACNNSYKEMNRIIRIL